MTGKKLHNMIIPICRNLKPVLLDGMSAASTIARAVVSTAGKRNLAAAMCRRRNCCESWGNLSRPRFLPYEFNTVGPLGSLCGLPSNQDLR